LARDDRNLRCSFCGKTQDEVEKLIAGPGGVFICDECVNLCNDIIMEDIKRSQPSRTKKNGQGGLKPLPKTPGDQRDL